MPIPLETVLFAIAVIAILGDVYVAVFIILPMAKKIEFYKNHVRHLEDELSHTRRQLGDFAELLQDCNSLLEE